MEAFVYCWTDHQTQKLYIGSHKGSLDDGYVCSSKTMMEQYNKRPSDFTRQIIAESDTYSDMRNLEYKILESVDARKNPYYYNLHNGHGELYCKGHTEETRQKMSESGKRKIFTEDHRRKLSEALKGKTHTEETKQKISKLKKGKTHTEEAKRKISEAGKGRIFSEETRQKISEANKGDNHRRGTKHSEETKRKMSESAKGKPKSKEHIRNLVLSRKANRIKKDLECAGN